MTQYKTYQEAKIANPKIDIFTKKSESIFQAIKSPETNHFIDGWQICKPKDYCISLESFLSSGKRAVMGDIIVGRDGRAITVVAENMVNTQAEADCGIYVLKAKALESPANEWVNGDECVNDHHNYSRANKMTYIGAHPFVHGKHVCLSELKGLVIVDSMWLRKPETPEQKLERQRLESAYHLACIAGAVDKWGGEFTFDDFKLDGNAVKQWLAVVDETKYLRGEK